MKIKNCVKIYTEEGLEDIWNERIEMDGEFIHYEHGIIMTAFDEYGLSAYWDYRTENEIRNGSYDVELGWNEIADELGYDKMEYATDEDGNSIVIAWNND